MGVLFGDAAANFAATISSIVILTRLALAAQLLAGLHVYRAQAAGKEQAGSAPPLSSRSGKQERRAARLAARQQIHIEGAEQIARYRLFKSHVHMAHFYHEFELLVLGGVILLLNFALAATPLVSLKTANYKWPLWLAAAYPILTAGTMAKVELFTPSVTGRDKGLLAGLCSLLVLAAVLLLTFVPPGALDFRWEEAAAELGWTITTGLRKIVFSAEVPAVTVSPAALKGGLATVAGLTAGFLAPGAARLCRALVLTLNPPPATRQYLRPSRLSTALMQLSVALPLAGALLWVRPMAQDLFGWSDGTVRLIRAAYLTAMALVQLLALRPFVQGFLNSGLVEWWTQKHALTAADSGSRELRAIGELIRVRVDLLNMLLCKVAAEMLAPAAVWGACAAVLVFTICKQTQQPPGWTWLPWPWYLHLKSPEDGPWIPSQLLTTAAGFLAWWTSLCWAALTALVLCMHRIGLLTA